MNEPTEPLVPATLAERTGCAFVSALPITEPITKFGGQPVWLTEPTWPLSRSLGTPMRFIGQVRLPGDEPKLAYFFMTEDDTQHVEDTWEPAGGENACLVQPGPAPTHVRTEPLTTGPGYGTDHLVRAAPLDENADTFLGGEPEWMQYDETPGGRGWQFVAQFGLDLPFEPNFGDAGIAYTFVRPETGDGVFLWQCG